MPREGSIGPRRFSGRSIVDARRVSEAERLGWVLLLRRLAGSVISQLVKVDDATWAQMGPSGQRALAEIESALNLRILRLEPLQFSHAYLLLGQSPSRSGHDLT